jgi:hypothetical protein
VISEPESLTLAWTPRAAELADATLARNREVGGAGARAVVGCLVAVLGAVTLTNPYGVLSGLALIAVAFLLVFHRLTVPLSRRRWAAALTANPILAEACEVTLDESGIHLSSARYSTSRQWSTFPSWTDAPGAVVLSTSGTAAGHTLVIPDRAAASNEETAALRRLVAAHLGPSEGAGPGRTSRRVVAWLARLVVVACLVVPLGVALTRVHDEEGEWRLWPSEAPPELTRNGTAYVREGGPVPMPPLVTGSDYTPGGGLVMVTFPPPESGPPPELWVLDHHGVVRHYVTSP